MRGEAAFRGQPLLLLAGLLGGWFALRASTWQPFPALPAASPALADAAPLLAHVTTPVAAVSVTMATPLAVRLAFASPAVPIVPELSGSERLLTAERPPVAASSRAGGVAPASPRYAVGHNLLLAVGLGHMELPGAWLARLQEPAPDAGVPAAAPSFVAAPEPVTATRWSGDGWLLLRHETTGPVPAGLPSYGRSQAGAVVRYALAPASGHRPQAYARASAALAGPRDEEIAAGVSARPFARAPLRLAAEARLGRTTAGTEVRPAIYAVTELAPFRLPFGASGEAYFQGGYVGGRFATGFVDGQARAERPVARIGETELSAGAGAWGGAQKGAARLDVGPTAALAFRLGDTRGRLAADYRFRIAGDAQPASGPALTISAGF